MSSSDGGLDPKQVPDRKQVLASLRGNSVGQQLDPRVLDCALFAFETAWAEGRLKKKILVVVNYLLPALQRRLWVIDRAAIKFLFYTQVAHAKNSGPKGGVPHSFSNTEGSEQSSVGALVTGAYLRESKWPSGKLELHGLEPRFNDNALSRGIVMHGADYVASGGRSQGCPAMVPSVAQAIMLHIEKGSLLFCYGNDSRWLSQSRFIPRE